VALTGLTYSYDSFGATSAQDGLANVTDWTAFSEHDQFSRELISTPDSERYSAHSFGLFSVILKNQPLTKPGEGDPNEPLDKPIEVGSDGSWNYYFREFNPKPKNPHNNLAHKSKRYVTISATCEYYALVNGQYGNSSTVAYQNGTEKTTLSEIAVSHTPSSPWPLLEILTPCRTTAPQQRLFPSSSGYVYHTNPTQDLDQPAIRSSSKRAMGLRPTLCESSGPPIPGLKRNR